MPQEDQKIIQSAEKLVSSSQETLKKIGEFEAAKKEVDEIVKKGVGQLDTIEKTGNNILKYIFKALDYEDDFYNKVINFFTTELKILIPIFFGSLAVKDSEYLIIDRKLLAIILTLNIVAAAIVLILIFTQKKNIRKKAEDSLSLHWSIIDQRMALLNATIANLDSKTEIMIKAFENAKQSSENTTKIEKELKKLTKEK